ncbi:MAG: hypothetical protein KBS94_00535 [Prevotella sp.]|nr:hypothetical protein [Candidatus Equicola faecalis]
MQKEAPLQKENNMSMDNREFLTFDETEKVLMRCDTIASGEIIIPNSVTSIGNSTFKYALNLKKIDARTQSIDEVNRLAQIIKKLHTWGYTFKNDSDDTSDDLPF